MESRAQQAQGYRREAEKYANLAKSGQLDITNTHRTIAQRYAWMAENLQRREDLTHTMVALLGGQRIALASTSSAGPSIGGRFGSPT
jgi:hypothetical protein